MFQVRGKTHRFIPEQKLPFSDGLRIILRPSVFCSRQTEWKKELMLRLPGTPKFALAHKSLK